jgi:hypothetical protein
VSRQHGDGDIVKTYNDFEDRQIKHLEMVQTVIARLAGNSFLIKGWATTIAAAFLGFAINTKQWELAVASVLPTLTFWGLDAYFLRAERLFRVLYERIRKQDDVPPFFMGATSSAYADRARGLQRRGATSWTGALVSVTLGAFYGVLVAASGVVLAVVLSID